MSAESVPISVTAFDLDPEIGRSASTTDVELVVLPLAMVDGAAVYTESSVMLVKELRTLGTDASFLDPSGKRSFEVKKSAIGSAIVTLIIGIGSSAAWDGMKSLLRRKNAGRLSVTYVELEASHDQRGKAWAVDGDTEGVVKAIDALRSGTPAVELPDSSPTSQLSGVSNQTVFQEAGSDEDLQAAYVKDQIFWRRAEADRLVARASVLIAQSSGVQDAAEAESHAREALALYRASLDWAEDTDFEEEAHHLMDEAGAWVRKTFGCELTRTGEEYQQDCPVALGHDRLGLSVGGRSTLRVCSLCGVDVSECEHLPGTAYLVPGGSEDLGWCRVCCKDACEHSAKETYRASVVSIIQEMSLDEVSLVSKPAHPEARIHSVSVSVSDLKELLGDGFTAGMDVSCDQCLSPCGGLIRHDIPHG